MHRHDIYTRLLYIVVLVFLFHVPKARFIIAGIASLTVCIGKNLVNVEISSFCDSVLLPCILLVVCFLPVESRSVEFTVEFTELRHVTLLLYWITRCCIHLVMLFQSML